MSKRRSINFESFFFAFLRSFSSTTTIAMQSSTSSAFRQQFIPLLPEAHSRVRQHSAPSSNSSASIWAPQPQSPGGTWPRSVFTLDDSESEYTRVHCYNQGPVPANCERPRTKEDVFGPFGNTANAMPSRTVLGAIGEGREREGPSHEVDVRFLSQHICAPTCVS